MTTELSLILAAVVYSMLLLLLTSYLDQMASFSTSSLVRIITKSRSGIGRNIVSNDASGYVCSPLMTKNDN